MAERLVCKHYLYQDGKEYCKKVKTRATCGGMNTFSRCDFPMYKSIPNLLKKRVRDPYEHMKKTTDNTPNWAERGDI